MRCRSAGAAAWALAAASAWQELLSGLPAVLVVGPRATGKTTTAARRAATLVRLRRSAEAAAFHADPDAAAGTDSSA